MADRFRPRPVKKEKSDTRPLWAYAVGSLRGRYIAGLLILAPFLLTYVIFDWMFGVVSNLLRPLLFDWFGFRIPGTGVAIPLIGLLIIVLAPLTIGTLGIYVFGQRVLFAVEAVVVRIPVIGSIFAVVQQLVASFGPGAETGFSRVVEIEYPRPGLWAIGFLTSVLDHEAGGEMGIVYVPTAPTPNSGWLAMVPMKDVYDLDMTVNQALRYALSGGVAAPTTLRRRAPNTAAARNDSPDPKSDQEGVRQV